MTTKSDEFEDHGYDAFPAPKSPTRLIQELRAENEDWVKRWRESTAEWEAKIRDLRAENDGLRRLLKGANMEAQAENERLRAALLEAAADVDARAKEIEGLRAALDRIARMSHFSDLSDARGVAMKALDRV